MSKLYLLGSLRFNKEGVSRVFVESLPPKYVLNQFVTMNAVNLERFHRYLNSSMFSRLLLLDGISGTPSPPTPSFSLLLLFSWDVVKFFWKCLPFPFITEQV